MVRLLRHDDSVNREEDGAVRFEDLASICRSKNEFTSHWSSQTWLSFLRKRGGPKHRFQYCFNPASPEHFLCIRAIPGHSGGALVDSALQDNELLPDNFIEYIYHVGNAHNLHSIIQSGFREAKVLGKTDMRCTSQLSTR